LLLSMLFSSGATGFLEKNTIQIIVHV
jgi:hypothetical protein